MCLYKNNLYPQGVASIYRYWSFFIILSYSYLTLPEKQSSSAVTWASPGCHVFLKGCLRGILQMEPFTYYMFHTSLIIFGFCSPRISQWIAVSFILPALPYCHVTFYFLSVPACSNQLRSKIWNLIVEALQVAAIHLTIPKIDHKWRNLLTFTTQAETVQLIVHLNCFLHRMFQMFIFLFLFKSTPRNHCFHFLS